MNEMNHKLYGKGNFYINEGDFYTNEETFMVAKALAVAYDSHIHPVYSKVIKMNKKQFIYFLKTKIIGKNVKIDYNKLNISQLKNNLRKYKNINK